MLSPRYARGAPRNVLTLTFTVRWDEDSAKFIARDTGGAILNASSDKSNAIYSACREASITSRAGVRVLVMVQGEDGRMCHGWTAEPMLKEGLTISG
jgi:hypothetical protein